MHDIPREKEFAPDLLGKYQGGICRSEDGLLSWRLSNGGLPQKTIATHIVLDPASPPGRRTLYAAVFDQGVYKSSDDGATWELKSRGLDPANLYAWRLCRLPDGALYLVVVKDQRPGQDNPGALYRSTDGAESWEKLALPPGVVFPNDLTYDPRRPERLYLSCWPKTVDGLEACGGMYGSEDGGNTWASLFDPAAHVFSVTVLPDNPDTLYMATFDAAACRSDDRGHTWRALDGFDFQWCYRVLSDPRQPGMVYLATFGSSLWYGRG
jgi:hypothetical protein